MSQKEGINPDEVVIYSTQCKYYKLSGELVLTEKGIVFLKSTGLFKSGRERIHFYSFDDI